MSVLQEKIERLALLCDSVSAKDRADFNIRAATLAKSHLRDMIKFLQIRHGTKYSGNVLVTHNGFSVRLAPIAQGAPTYDIFGKGLITPLRQEYKLTVQIDGVPPRSLKWNGVVVSVARLSALLGNPQELLKLTSKKALISHGDI